MRGEGTDGDGRPEVRAPALRWRREFPGDNAQIGALRRWLESLLPPCPARDDLVSVAVELSTNAVRHTVSGNGGQFAIEVTWSVQMARVAVYDGGAPDGPRVIENPLGEDWTGFAVQVLAVAASSLMSALLWTVPTWHRSGPDPPVRRGRSAPGGASSLALRPWRGSGRAAGCLIVRDPAASGTRHPQASRTGSCRRRHGSALRQPRPRSGPCPVR